jgi:hypothetical protein
VELVWLEGLDWVEGVFGYLWKFFWGERLIVRLADI